MFKRQTKKVINSDFTSPSNRLVLIYLINCVATRNKVVLAAFFEETFLFVLVSLFLCLHLAGSVLVPGGFFNSFKVDPTDLANYVPVVNNFLSRVLTTSKGPHKFVLAFTADKPVKPHVS